MTELPIWLALFHALGSAALGAFTYSIILRLESVDSRRIVAQILHAILFSAFALVTMASPVVLPSGIVFDGRAILVALSGPFGGYPALLATTVATSAHRTMTGGAGVWAGLAGIFIVASCSLVFTYWYRLNPRRTNVANVLAIIGFAVVASLSMLLGLFLLPLPTALSVLERMAIPLTVGNVGGIVCVALFLLRITELHRQSEALKMIATKDPLTTVLNRRGIEEAAKRFEETYRETGRKFSLLLLDIDYFKRINDICGHAVGDMTLRHFAQTVRQQVGEAGLVGRAGGEEFIVLLNFAGKEKVMELAERIKGSIAIDRINADGVPIEITVSIGAAEIGKTNPTFSKTLAIADAGLYAAKFRGRNMAVWGMESEADKARHVIKFSHKQNLMRDAS